MDIHPIAFLKIKRDLFYFLRGRINNAGKHEMEQKQEGLIFIKIFVRIKSFTF